MDLSMQYKNLFAAKSKINWQCIKSLWLEYRRTSHFLAYCPTWFLSNKTIQKNLGQFFLILALNNTLIKTKNNIFLKIIALRNN